jgi:hypothetical protein
MPKIRYQNAKIWALLSRDDRLDIPNIEGLKSHSDAFPVGQVRYGCPDECRLIHKDIHTTLQGEYATRVKKKDLLPN